MLIFSDIVSFFPFHAGFTVDSIEDGVAQLAVFGDDLNNNDNTVGNQNMSMIETVYIN